MTWGQWPACSTWHLVQNSFHIPGSLLLCSIASILSGSKGVRSNLLHLSASAWAFAPLLSQFLIFQGKSKGSCSHPPGPSVTRLFPPPPRSSWADTNCSSKTPWKENAPGAPLLPGRHILTSFFHRGEWDRALFPPIALVGKERRWRRWRRRSWLSSLFPAPAC